MWCINTGFKKKEDMYESFGKSTTARVDCEVVEGEKNEDGSDT